MLVRGVVQVLQFGRTVCLSLTPLVFTLLKCAHPLQDVLCLSGPESYGEELRDQNQTSFVSEGSSIWSKCPRDACAWKCFTHVDLTEGRIKNSAWTGSTFGSPGRAGKLCWWEVRRWHRTKSAAWESDQKSIQSKSCNLLQKACVLSNSFLAAYSPTSLFSASSSLLLAVYVEQTQI